MQKISKQKLHISNLPKLFRGNWFEKEWDKVREEVGELLRRRPQINLQTDQQKHQFIVDALKREEYVVAAYVIHAVTDIFNQSPMAYAMEFDDPSLLFALFAFGESVNGQYYKDLDDNEWYSLFRLAYESESETLVNLLLLHPNLELNQVEWTESDLSEISVFMGQGYQYEYFYPALILLDTKYHQVLPFLNVDVNHVYDNDERTLFWIASEQEDFDSMTQLYKLGANILPESYDWGCPLTKAIHEYKRKGQSAILDWYADIYKPLIDKDSDLGGGLLQLMNSDVSEELRAKFGLQYWPVEQPEPEFDELEIAKQQYRIFAPNPQPVFKVSQSLGEIALAMDDYDHDIPGTTYPRSPFRFERPADFHPVSIFNDFERVYKLAFHSRISDVRVGIRHRSLEIIIADQYAYEDSYLIPEKESLIALGAESTSNFQYIDIDNITEYQLVHLLLNSEIDDVLLLHHFLKDAHDVDLFCFDSGAEYRYCRGICGGDYSLPEKQKEKRAAEAIDLFLP